MQPQRWRRAVCLIAAGSLCAGQDAIFWVGQLPNETTAFRLVTDFHPTQVAPERNARHKVELRLVPVHPLADKEEKIRNSFRYDQELVERSGGKMALPEKPQSVEYRWRVERPGQDVLYLMARKPLFLSDRNRMFALYARGAGHPHHVFALLRGPNQIRQEIFVCSLDYFGWKRFEVVIPPYLQLRNPHRQNRYELYFDGLKIQSHFRDQPGMSVFNLAAMFIMADTADAKIPGAQMPQEF
ncbi:MAG: flagellar filament outer layer protein FlaA [Turneriella sp.]|nr:flagellar filament outer layer protein FlaA [Turneriella sp.]